MTACGWPSAATSWIVTTNHRLNLFGYLNLGRLWRPSCRDSGAVGALDMIHSLKWVRDNIAAFGGDPNKVLDLRRIRRRLERSAR